MQHWMCIMTDGVTEIISKREDKSLINKIKKYIKKNRKQEVTK